MALADRIGDSRGFVQPHQSPSRTHAGSGQRAGGSEGVPRRRMPRRASRGNMSRGYGKRTCTDTVCVCGDGRVASSGPSEALFPGSDSPKPDAGDAADGLSNAHRSLRAVACCNALLPSLQPARRCSRIPREAAENGKKWKMSDGQRVSTPLTTDQPMAAARLFTRGNFRRMSQGCRQTRRMRLASRKPIADVGRERAKLSERGSLIGCAQPPRDFSQLPGSCSQQRQLPPAGVGAQRPFNLGATVGRRCQGLGVWV